MVRFRSFYIIFLLILPSLMSAAETVALDGGNTCYFRDDSRSMDIQQIIKLPETVWESSGEELYFGYTEDNIWLRFSLERAVSQPLFLTEHHGIDQFDVWLLEQDSSKPEFLGTSGWAVYSERQDSEVLQAFSTVSIIPERSVGSVLFIRVRSTSSLSPTFLLFDVEAFQRALRATNLVQGMGLGSSAMMIIFALIIMVFSWRREFVYFFLLVLATTFLGLYIGGLGPLVFWRDSPGFTLFAGLSSVPLLLIVTIRFFRSILNLENFPGYAKGLLGFEIFMWLSLIVLNIVPKTTGFHLSSSVNLLMILYLQTILVISVILRMRYSKYLLAAWSVTLIAGLYQMLLNLGLVPYIPDIYNSGFIIMFAFLIQNSILGGTIVVQSEMSIVDERLLRRNAEHQVKDAREKLIQSDRMGGLATMVSSVAHEIATPVGNARMLGSEIEQRSRELLNSADQEDPDKEKDRDFLEFAGESGGLIVETLSHAGSIMESFKVVAADKAIVKEKSIDIREYFSRIERVLTTKVKKSHHELKVFIEAEGSIHTVPGYLTQVVDNLVNNAITHAFPGSRRGTITIEVRQNKENGIEITISDDGAGISEEVLPHIFEMFYTTRDGEGGTGLGLAISKTLAEEYLEGSLKCFTEKDKGTRFVFVVADLSSTGESFSVD